MRKKIIAGTRGSRLALLQTGSVIELLKRANPGLEIEIKKIITAGDRDRSNPPDRLGKDIFVKEIEEAILRGEIDIAVHSLKDLPSSLPEGLSILATPERLNPGDVLISPAGRLEELPRGSRIGTGSLRRRAQLAAYRPDLTSCPIRGNIETRLRKLAAREFDAIMLGAAALIRLNRQSEITEFLPLDIFLPAAGQGALAIEGRQDDEETAGIVLPVNHNPTWRCVTAERALLKTLGGGCRAPVAALGTAQGNKLKLDAMVLSLDGKRVCRASDEDKNLSPQELGTSLGRKLLSAGAWKLIEEAMSS